MDWRARDLFDGSSRDCLRFSEILQDVETGDANVSMLLDAIIAPARGTLKTATHRLMSATRLFLIWAGMFIGVRTLFQRPRESGFRAAYGP